MGLLWNSSLVEKSRALRWSRKRIAVLVLEDIIAINDTESLLLDLWLLLEDIEELEALRRVGRLCLMLSVMSFLCLCSLCRGCWMEGYLLWEEV